MDFTLYLQAGVFSVPWTFVSICYGPFLGHVLFVPGFVLKILLLAEWCMLLVLVFVLLFHSCDLGLVWQLKEATVIVVDVFFFIINYLKANNSYKNHPRSISLTINFVVQLYWLTLTTNSTSHISNEKKLD